MELSGSLIFSDVPKLPFVEHVRGVLQIGAFLHPVPLGLLECFGIVSAVHLIYCNSFQFVVCVLEMPAAFFSYQGSVLVPPTSLVLLCGIFRFDRAAGEAARKVQDAAEQGETASECK